MCRSIGIGITFEGIEHGEEYYLEIEEDVPVMYVPDIVFHALLHLPEMARASAIAVDLRPACDAGLDGVAEHVFVDQT